MSVDAVPRLRGHALQRRRAALFLKRPWCVDCEAQGRQTQATIRDHLVPLAEGGTEDPENENPLCVDCFEAKKEAEARRGLRSYGLTKAFRKAATPRDARGQFSVRRTSKAGQQRHAPDAPDDEAA